MLSEKPWNRELLLLLLSALLLSWCLGMVFGILLEQILPLDAVAAKSFYHFVISTLTFHVATLLLVHQFLKLNGASWKQFLGLSKPHLARAILFAIVAAILVLPMIWILRVWSARVMNVVRLEPVPQPSIKALESAVSVGQQICFGAAAILLAPLAEEALFRGILYPFLKQRGHRLVAFFGTSFLFALFHSNVVTFLPLAFFAFVLIFIYEKTDKLVAPILTHAFFNAVNFFFFIFAAELNHFFQQVNRFLHQLR